MGQVNIEHDQHHVTRTLLASTLVGRHWRCDIRIDEPRIPLYWLEIRWMNDTWGWRELTDTGGTRGTGVSVSRGWRTLTCQGQKSPRVRHPPNVSLVFTDLSGCSWSVENRLTGVHLSRAEAEDRVEVWGEVPRLVDWEQLEPAGPPLKDGSCFASDGVPYRFHAGAPPVQTSISRLDITSEHIRLDLDAQALTATFTSGNREAQVHGEFIRTLLIYAEARRDEHFDDGGWLTRAEAHGRWLAAGGNPDSREERIGWDRGKIRTHLAEAGADRLQHLFESARSGNGVSMRLALSPSQISIT